MVSYYYYTQNHYDQTKTETLPAGNDHTSYYMYQFKSKKERIRMGNRGLKTKRREHLLKGKLGMFGQEMTWERTDSL